MPNKDLTEVIFLLDRSGSMSSTKKDAMGGFDEFIKEQVETTEGECQVTLCQFDTDGFDVVYENKPVAEVPPLVLMPRGGTPLIDAMGQVITETGKRFENMPDARRPDNVVVVIITDGQENSSRKYSREQVMAMVEHQTERYLWRFMYLGANQDAIAEAASYGVKSADAMSFAANTEGTKGSYKSASSNVARMRSAKFAGVSQEEVATCSSFGFQQEDRDEQTEAGVDPSLNAASSDGK